MMQVRSWAKSALWGGSLGFQAVFIGSLLLPLLTTLSYRLTSDAPLWEFGVTEMILEYGTMTAAVFIFAAIPGTLGGVLLGFLLRLTTLWRHPLPIYVGGILGAALGSAAGMGAYYLVLRLLGISSPRLHESVAAIVLGLSLVLGSLAGLFLAWAINQEQNGAV